jgi:hypothetical protein
MSVAKQSRQPRRSKSVGAGSTRAALDRPTRNDLEELVQTSKLVPYVAAKTDTRVQLDTPATTAPSSAVPSPLLECIVNDAVGEAWPSLREAVNGWDFCSDGSDTDDLWENLPEPALDIDHDFQYVDLSKSVQDAKQLTTITAEKPDEEAVDTKENSEKDTDAMASMLNRSLAELLRNRDSTDGGQIHVQPAVNGTRLQTRRRCSRKPKPSMSVRGQVPIVASTSQDPLCDQSDFRQRGWMKQHKACWNKKMRRKVTAKVTRRTEQSCKSRGWLKDEHDTDGEK